MLIYVFYREIVAKFTAMGFYFVNPKYSLNARPITVTAK
jgi:hypothetical protein